MNILNTGVFLHLYTTKEELLNAKNGVSTILAWVKGKQPENAIYHIHISLDVCDVLDNEVRVNVSKVLNQLENIGITMGDAIGREIEKMVNKF